MNLQDVLFQAKMSGYLFVYDRAGFISVFDNPNIVLKEDQTAQCIYRHQADCKTKKEFELEIIFVHQQVTSL